LSVVLAAALLCFLPVDSYADYAFDFIRFEHRVYETPADNHDRLAFSVIDTATGLAPTENVYADGYVRLGTDDVPGVGSLSIYEYKQRTYDASTGTWTDQQRNDLYYRYKFDDPLAVDTYDLQVEFTNGQVENLQLAYPGYTDLPFVSAASFEFALTAGGDLLWNWELPDNLPADLKLQAYLGSWEDARDIYLLMPATFDSVVVPKEYLDFVGYENIQFFVNLRENVTNRGYSDTVAIADLTTLPTATVPIPSTLTLLGMGLLGIVGCRRKSRRP
jgi:hypothetical protein